MSTRSAVARCTTAALITVLTTAALRAQDAPPRLEGRTPGDCVKGANDWRNGEMTAVRAALTAKEIDAAAYTERYSRTMTQAQQLARDCAARFSVHGTAPADLMELVQLYRFIGDTMQAGRAVARALDAVELAPRARAEVLSAAMSQEITRNAQYFGRLESAERYMAQLDALPDSLAAIKLGAHQTLLGRYEYLDVADGLHDHAVAVIRLARQLNQPQAMISAYTSLARSASDKLMPDSALRVLDRAEKELASVQHASEVFADFRHRIGLIGSRAPEISADWWINREGVSNPFQPGSGKVTIVEFTAHWCMPCVNSYPGVKALAKRFEGRPFEIVMVTSLYGYLGDQKNLTPEQEVEADREYFGHKHGVPAPVGITRPARSVPGQTAERPPSNDAEYRVGGIPTIFIVDQAGIIRQIVIGWDQGNTERIGTYIEELLRNPPR